MTRALEFVAGLVAIGGLWGVILAWAVVLA